jgi:hypothetical protein
VCLTAAVLIAGAAAAVLVLTADPINHLNDRWGGWLHDCGRGRGGASDACTIVWVVTTWHPSTSTAIEAYAYDAPAQLLHLRFRDGGTTYDYPCTPPLFENFLRAPSKGRFVTEILKPYAQFRGTSPRPGRSR